MGSSYGINLNTFCFN